MRKIIVGIGLFFALFFILIVGVIQFIKTDIAQGWIQNRINRMIQGQLTWDQLRLSLLKGEVELSGIALSGISGEDIISIRRLIVDLEWAPLIRREIAIERMLIDQPQVQLLLHNDGSLNLMKAVAVPASGAESGSGSFSFNILLKSFLLSDGALRFITDDDRTRIHMPYIQIDADGNLKEQAGNVHLKTREGFVQFKTIRSDIGQIALSGKYNKGCVPDLAITVKTPALNGTLQGSLIDIFHTLRPDLHMNLETDLSRLMPLLGQDIPISGLVSLRLALSGTLNEPSAILHMDYGNGVLFSHAVDEMTVTMALNNRMLSFDDWQIRSVFGESHLRGFVDFQNVFPMGFMDSGPDMNQLEYELVLNQEKMRLAQVFPGFDNIKGELISQIQATGKGVSLDTLSADIHLKASAELSSGTIQDSPVIELKGKAVLNGPLLAIDSLTLDSPDTRFYGTGKINLVDKTIASSIQMIAEDLRTLAFLPGIEESHGKVSIDAEIKGTFQQPVANVTVKGNHLGVRGISLGDLDLAVGLTDKGWLNLSRLSLKNNQADINGHGRLQLFSKSNAPITARPLNLAIDFNHVNPEYFRKGSIITGEFNGQFTAEGTMDRLNASLGIKGNQMVLSNYLLGEIDSALRFEQGRLWIDRTDLQYKDSMLQLSGDIALLASDRFKPLKDPSGRLEIRADTVHLQDWMEQGSGNVSLNARMEGKLSELKGNLILQGKDMVLYGQNMPVLYLEGDLEGDRFTVHPLEITFAEEEVVQLTGWIDRNKTYACALTSNGIDVTNLDAIREKADFLQGQLSLHLKGQGTIDNPKIDGDIRLSQIRMDQKAFEDMHLTVGLENQVARLSGNVQADIDGIYRFGENTFSLKAVFHETDLAPYFMLLDQPQFAGHLNGKIDISGQANNLKSYRGDLDFSDLMVLFEETPLVQSHRLRLSLKNNEFIIQDFSLLLPEAGRLDITGYGKTDASISMKADGKIPLKVINIFQKDLADIGGELTLTAAIEGTVSSPVYQAEAKLDNLTMVLPYLNQTLHDTDAVIRITPQRIFIDSVMGKLDTGEFEIAGEIDMDHYLPVSIRARIHTSQVPINIPDTLDLTFSTDISLSGQPDQSVLEGTLTLIEGVYYKNVNLYPLDALGQKKRKVTLPVKSINTPFLKNMVLNVDVKHQRSFAVDNNIAIMNIVPQLKIKGTLNHPVINGRTTVSSGEVTFRGKTFLIKKGVIDFINPYETEPTIDIHGEQQIRDWTIFLDISGTPDRLGFKLSSQPFLEDADILSLLVLGKTAGEMSAGEGGSDLSAAQMLSQFIASTYDEEIKNATGLDIFEAEFNGQDDHGGTNGVKITLGKELSKRVVIKYSAQNEKGDMVQRATAEYKLLEEVLLSIFQGNKGVFGGSATYRLEFR